ncbi:hypothetical protein JCM31447_16720 [Fluviispira sanaruensis]|uniref:Uncharacterized protein n=1 Tax=Fluviispira sanaruensis TaxID=2493639 RepID=A0A4P2VNM3_FLUSA|nr:hypothetical protein JCM31447_16720 [Fluviispira sanaruensis]
MSVSKKHYFNLFVHNTFKKLIFPSHTLHIPNTRVNTKLIALCMMNAEESYSALYE